MHMRVLFQLFLQRFKKLRFSIPLGIWLPFILYRLIKYLAKGTWDEAFFDWLLQLIKDSTGRTMAIENIVLIGIPSLGIAGILIWMYIDARSQFKSDYLTDALTKMHERMLHFVTLRVKSVGDNKWLDDAVPELLHKWGLIDIGGWDTFKSKLLSRIKRSVPKTDVSKPTMWFKVVSTVEKIRKELLNSKEWQEEDVFKIGEWLDEQNRGLSEYRDKDRKWNRLNKTLKPYEVDTKLRALIKQHKDYSYGYCSVSLIERFMDKHRGHPVTKMLLNVLMGSPINKEQMNEGLYKVLDDIRKRMKRLQKQERVNVSGVKV